MIKYVNKLPLYLKIPLVALVGLFQVACNAAQLAETGNLASDTASLVLQGVADYNTVQASLTAAQQANGGHGISLGNIETYAKAILTPANATSASSIVTGATNAIAVVTNDVASLIKAGQTPAQVAATVATAQSTLPTSSTYYGIQTARLEAA